MYVQVSNRVMVLTDTQGEADEHTHTHTHTHRDIQGFRGGALGTFITSRLYLRTFCDIPLDTEHTKVTEGHQMNLVLTDSMHNYS